MLPTVTNPKISISLCSSLWAASPYRHSSKLRDANPKFYRPFFRVSCHAPVLPQWHRTWPHWPTPHPNWLCSLSLPRPFSNSCSTPFLALLLETTDFRFDMKSITAINSQHEHHHNESRSYSYSSSSRHRRAPPARIDCHGNRQKQNRRPKSFVPQIHFPNGAPLWHRKYMG